MTGVKRKYENPMPEVDEGWWESVLAEETRFSASPPPRGTAIKKQGGVEAKEEAEEKAISVNWDQVKDLYMRDEVVELNVTGFNRGGLLVEGDGLFGFVPLSHLVELAGKPDLPDRTSELEGYVGRAMQLKVIECTPEDGRVVFSERAAQSESGKRAELFHELKAGQSVQGLVTNITDFGVFVDLGGVEGLVHISELSWGRVMHPNQIVKLGDAITVQVLDLIPERCRVALSLKRLLPNPWENAARDFPEGSIQPASITKVLSYGIFARLDAGVEGLVHISEIPQAIDDKPLKDLFSVGNRVQVRVLHLEAAHQRMGLSMRLE
jgi:small subunit ribosomal protein S1